MFALVVMVAPLFAGLLVILIIARYAPNVPRTEVLRAGDAVDGRPEITGDEFKDVLEQLVAALDLETIFSSMGTGGVIEMTLRDPKPLTGGRLILFATPVLQGQVESTEVLGFAEGVRADMGALKGIFVALAGFTDEAKRIVTTVAAPVDLIDGEGLLALIREHLDADTADVVTRYRGFGRLSRFEKRHVSAGQGDGDEEDDEEDDIERDEEDAEDDGGEGNE